MRSGLLIAKLTPTPAPIELPMMSTRSTPSASRNGATTPCVVTVGWPPTSDTKVDVNTAMVAASRLQALIDARAGQPDVVDFWVKTNRIIAAVKSMLPESSWPELVRRIEGDAPANPQHHRIGTVHDADEEYAPRQFADTDDDEVDDDDW
jgi:hypothetical protein